MKTNKTKPRMGDDRMPGLRDADGNIPSPELGFVIRLEMMRSTQFGEPYWKAREEIWCDGKVLGVRQQIPDMAGAPILELTLERMKHDLLQAFHKDSVRPCGACGRSGE